MQDCSPTSTFPAFEHLKVSRLLKSPYPASLDIIISLSPLTQILCNFHAWNRQYDPMVFEFKDTSSMIPRRLCNKHMHVKKKEYNLFEIAFTYYFYECKPLSGVKLIYQKIMTANRISSSSEVLLN